MGVEITNSLSLGEDIFIEVSHGPTLLDNNLFLSACAGRISTQGIAFVHNLIAGSFTYVGKGTDNQALTLQSCRYTPYHVAHRTEVAGFMTILHGDARFYNNIFVQQPVREDLKRVSESSIYDKEEGGPGVVQFVCGTRPYDEYPTLEEYVARFNAHLPMDSEDKDRYYDHLPVWTGGNAYFNGAQPCRKESDAVVDGAHTVRLELAEREGAYTLSTNLYEFLPDGANQTISTKILGMAFEPEQYFEQPNGDPIVFAEDYFGAHRPLNPLSGPFAERYQEVSL